MEERITRKVYPDEFKRESVRLAIEWVNVSQAARDSGSADSFLFRWKPQLTSTPANEQTFPDFSHPRDAEVAYL